MKTKMTPIRALRLILMVMAVAWLTPIIVAFIPWNLSEEILREYIPSKPLAPILKYWFVMASLLSGFVGGVLVYLLYNTLEKLRMVLFVGFFHILLALILLIRGLLWKVSLVIVLWDSSFCFIVGAIAVVLSLIQMRLIEDSCD